MKKFLAGLSAVAVLAAGGVAMVGLSSGVANAQEDTTTTEEAQDEGRRHKRGGRGLSTAADTIGIEVADLVAALQDGSTISEVAAANGSSGQAVVDAILANVSERIDAAVAAGDMTAEEGAERLASITERVNNMVDADLSEIGERRHGKRGRALGSAAETIGIEVADLVAALQEGSTIAEVAEANGSSGEAVIDAAVAAASERIDAAVANGRMTAEEGAEKLAAFTERVTEKVNTVIDFSERGNRGPRGPQGEDAVDA